jgi:hypothetical protein
VNVSIYIDFMLSGIEILVKLVQPENALFATTNTPSGIEILPKLVQPVNA